MARTLLIACLLAGAASRRVYIPAEGGDDEAIARFILESASADEYDDAYADEGTGRLDALKRDDAAVKLTCPLGSLELNATEARLLARDATEVTAAAVARLRGAVVAALKALDRRITDPRWLAGSLNVNRECRGKLEAALVASASPAQHAMKQLVSTVLARAAAALALLRLPELPSLEPLSDVLQPAMRAVHKGKRVLEASPSTFVRAAPFALGVLAFFFVVWAVTCFSTVAWRLVASTASVLLPLTTLTALSAFVTFSVFAAGAMQLEVWGLFQRDFGFHLESQQPWPPAGAAACAFSGWLPLYCGLITAAILGVFFLVMYVRGLVCRVSFWLRRARKIDVDAALVAAASGSECVICFEDPAQLLVFLPCGHRCVCASCAERMDRRCPLCRARVRDRIAVVGKHQFRV